MPITFCLTRLVQLPKIPIVNFVAKRYVFSLKINVYNKFKFSFIIMFRFIHQTGTCRKRIHFFRLPPLTEEQLKLKDKISGRFHLIYRSPLNNYIAPLSILSTVTTVIVFSVCIYCAIKGYTLEELERNTRYGTRTIVTTNRYELVGFVFFFFTFNISVFLTVRRLPLRIYRDNNDYVAVFNSAVPFLKRYIYFAKGQVVPLKQTGILPWKDSRFKINGSRAILFYQHFRVPAELHQMVSEKYKYY